VAPCHGHGEVRRKDLPDLKEYQGNRARNFFVDDGIPAIDSSEFAQGEAANLMRLV